MKHTKQIKKKCNYWLYLPARSYYKIYIFSTADKDDQFWTSGNDVSQEGLWVWASTGYAFSFFDWHQGQPNNYDNQDYVNIETANEVSHWSDGKPTLPYSPLCERVGVL